MATTGLAEVGKSVVDVSFAIVSLSSMLEDHINHGESLIPFYDYDPSNRRIRLRRSDVGWKNCKFAVTSK